MVKQVLVASMVWSVMATGAAAGGGGADRPEWIGGRACSVDLPATGTITDAPTGMVLSSDARTPGATMFRAVGRGLEVNKTVAQDGTFALSVGASGDRVLLTGAQGRVTVARAGRSITLAMARSDDKAFQKASVLLAGSPAIRLFRAALGRMAAASLASEPGMALQLADALLRVMQDDAATAVAQVRRQVEQSTAGVTTGMRLVRLGAGGPTCFGAWRREVMEAWEEYEGCYHDFSWWSGGREACAFLYILQVESAWFKLLSCSAIRIK